VPLSAVHCGIAPDPTHDSNAERNHTEERNEFKKKNSAVLDNFLPKLRASDYDPVL